MDKKRKHVRLLVKVVGEIKPPGEEKTQKVRLADLGLGGVAVFSEKELKAGDALVVKITILKKKGENLIGEFPCKIRWANPYKEGFLAGVQFDQVIDQNNNFEFFSYIEESNEYFGSP